MIGAPETRRKAPPRKGGRHIEAERSPKWPRLGLILGAVVTLIVVGSIGVTVLFALPWYVPVLQPWAVIGGTLLLLLGFIVLTNAFQALGFARALGQELYASKKESRLITAGLYAYTRNPIYLGVILLLGGWFLITRLTMLLIATILFSALFGFVAKWEERELTERFGAQYEQYRRAVPFFIPHPHLRRHPAETSTRSRRPAASPASPKTNRATTEHKRRK